MLNDGREIPEEKGNDQDGGLTTEVAAMATVERYLKALHFYVFEK